MNKTVTINISGIIFNIDDEAYDKLKQYLSTIRGYFNKSEGRDEIMADIEARIAEMFQEKISESKQIIIMEDVDEVITVMGEPEAYMDEDASEHTSDESSTSQDRERKTGSGRLYRDGEGSVVGGVCSGIGYYFGFDPLLLRILIVVVMFFFGTGFFLYLLLWIIMPEAKTTAEKLEMKGKKVNVNNIGKAIEDEMGNIKETFNDLHNSARKAGGGPTIRKFSQAVRDIIEFFLRILALALKAIGKVIGAILVAFGLIFLTLFILSIAGYNQAFIVAQPEGIVTESYAEATSLIFNSPDQIILATMALLLIFGIPVAAIVYGGLRLLFNFRKEVKGLGLILVGLWFVGILSAVVVGVQMGSQFTSEEVVEESILLDSIAGDTLVLQIDKDLFRLTKRQRRWAARDFRMKLEDDAIYFAHVQLDVQRSRTDEISVTILRSARGNSSTTARERASEINYEWQQQDSLLVFKPYYSIPRNAQLRDQEVQIVVYLPANKAVKLGYQLDRIIYDIDNVTDTHDSEMIGKTWVMKKEGLTLLGDETEAI